MTAQTRAMSACSLKDEVKTKTQLNVSIGVATNKTVAKIASDAGKPDGLVVVPPGEEAAFLAPLPVRALFGIGPKTEARIRPAGIRTIGDLARLSDASAARLLGSGGTFLRDLALGIDDRAVEPEHERKSVGAETTFARDLPDGPELRAALSRITAEVAQRMRRAGVRAHTVALKLRYEDFRTISRQSSVKQPIDDEREIRRMAGHLLDAVVESGDHFRLVGVHCSRLTESAAQAELWQPGETTAVDARIEV